MIGSQLFCRSFFAVAPSARRADLRRLAKTCKGGEEAEEGRLWPREVSGKRPTVWGK